MLTKKQRRLLKALGVDFSLASTIKQSKFGQGVSNLTSVVKNKAQQAGNAVQNVGHRVKTTAKNVGYTAVNAPKDTFNATKTVVKDVVGGVKQGWNAGKSHVSDVTTGTKNSLNEFKTSNQAKINTLKTGMSDKTSETLTKRKDNFIQNAKDNIKRSRSEQAILHGIKDINKGVSDLQKKTNITADNYREQYGKFKNQAAKGYGQIKYGVTKFGESIGHSVNRGKQLVGGTVNRIFRRGRAYYY